MSKPKSLRELRKALLKGAARTPRHRLGLPGILRSVDGVRERTRRSTQTNSGSRIQPAPQTVETSNHNGRPNQRKAIAQQR